MIKFNTRALGRRPAVATGVALLVPAIALTLQPTPVEATSHEAADGARRYTTDTLRLTPLGSLTTGAFNQGASEIVAFDPLTDRGFVVNAAAGTVDVIDFADPTNPLKRGSLNTPGANSVAVSQGLLAVAMENTADKQAPGQVAFYNTTSLRQLRSLPVGALPDMTTFTPDGRTVLVANEGEPSGYGEGHRDPEGSVTLIDLSQGLRRAVVKTATFTHLNGREAQLNARGVRVYGPGSSAAQDLEPEYIAVNAKSTWAYVSLQENNALAILNLRQAKFTSLRPLGLKDHALNQHALDGNDRDGQALLRTAQVKGMYQPDAIATAHAGGKTYVVTANEGDARDYDGLSEESRIGSLSLDPAIDASAVPARLNVTTTSPRGASGYTELWSFGARSVSIRTARGELVWDSGSQLETVVAQRDPANFNANHDTNPSLDNRSDNKGPEPEGVAVGTIDGRRYAFVGLERVSAIAVFDITNPRAPFLATYASNRGLAAADSADAGDLGPEGLAFVSEADSPTGQALLLVGNEVSGTTTAWEISSLR